MLYGAIKPPPFLASVYHEDARNKSVFWKAVFRSLKSKNVQQRVAVLIFFLQAEIHRLCRPVSVSIGVAEHLAEERPSRLLERADAALYQAKQEKGSIWIEP